MADREALQQQVHGRIDRSESFEVEYLEREKVHGRIDRSEKPAMRQHQHSSVHGRIDRSERLRQARFA